MSEQKTVTTETRWQEDKEFYEQAIAQVSVKTGISGLSRRNIKVIKTCLIMRREELKSRKGHEIDYRIREIENVLEKLDGEN